MTDIKKWKSNEYEDKYSKINDTSQTGRRDWLHQDFLRKQKQLIKETEKDRIDPTFGLTNKYDKSNTKRLIKDNHQWLIKDKNGDDFDARMTKTPKKDFDSTYLSHTHNFRDYRTPKLLEFNDYNDIHINNPGVLIEQLNNTQDELDKITVSGEDGLLSKEKRDYFFSKCKQTFNSGEKNYGIITTLTFFKKFCISHNERHYTASNYNELKIDISKIDKILEVYTNKLYENVKTLKTLNRYINNEVKEERDTEYNDYTGIATFNKEFHETLILYRKAINNSKLTPDQTKNMTYEQCSNIFNSLSRPVETQSNYIKLLRSHLTQEKPYLDDIKQNLENLQHMAGRTIYTLKPTWYRTVEQVKESYRDAERRYENFIYTSQGMAGFESKRNYFEPLHKKRTPLWSKTMLSLGDNSLLKEFQEFAQEYINTADKLFRR